jgi:hypothetical protein
MYFGTTVMEVLAPMDLAQCEEGSVVFPLHERQTRAARGDGSGLGEWWRAEGEI